MRMPSSVFGSMMEGVTLGGFWCPEEGTRVAVEGIRFERGTSSKHRASRLGFVADPEVVLLIHVEAVGGAEASGVDLGLA